MDVTPTEAQEKLGKDSILLDVRTDQEVQIAKVEGSLHIPLQDLGRRIEEVDKSKDIYVLCHHGHRSGLATMILKNQGFKAFNVEGGIDRWSVEVDDSIPRY